MNPLRPAVLLGATALAGLSAAPALAATAPKPTALTLKAAHSSVAPKHKDTLTSTLKSGKTAIKNETVKLERRATGAKSWTVVSSKTTDSKGQDTWSVVPGSKKGQKEQYEVVFSGTKSYKASHSSVITVTVS